MKILAIETSCDETAAAIVEDGRKIISSVVNTQIEEHKKYGGVVPEIASRRHIENITSVVEQAFLDANMQSNEIDAIAVTTAPGLIGAVLVGVNFAKGLAMSLEKPLIPVHHIRGHIASNYITNTELKPPFLCLVVSGGHSHIVEVLDYTRFRVVGRTRDDAAGEAFDKVARSVGLTYPGGVLLDKLSQTGNPNTYPLPTPHTEGKYDFSFSGLKTAVINTVHNAEQKGIAIVREDMAASFCNKVADILWNRTEKALKDLNYNSLAIAGGVSANSWLRRRATQECKKNNIKLYMPDFKLCGDNAAMIGSQGYYEYLEGNFANMTLNGKPYMEIDAHF